MCVCYSFRVTRSGPPGGTNSETGPRRKASSAVSQSSPITPLVSSQINHDRLTVELIEPDGMPAMVRIVWPPQLTVVDPKRFPDIAATIARLFAEAATRLASINANKHR